MTGSVQSTHGTNSLISVRAGLTGQSEHMTKPPAAAIGRCGVTQASGRAGKCKELPPHSLACRAPARKKLRNLRALPKLQSAERQARSPARVAVAGYRDCSCRSAEREAESHPRKFTLVSRPRELMPNPSLKRSANGSPPGPVRGAVAFSTARAWRATAGSRLARTLGLTQNTPRLLFPNLPTSSASYELPISDVVRCPCRPSTSTTAPTSPRRRPASG